MKLAFNCYCTDPMSQEEKKGKDGLGPLESVLCKTALVLFCRFFFLQWVTLYMTQFNLSCLKFPRVIVMLPWCSNDTTQNTCPDTLFHWNKSHDLMCRQQQTTTRSQYYKLKVSCRAVCPHWFISWMWILNLDGNNQLQLYKIEYVFINHITDSSGLKNILGQQSIRVVCSHMR